MDLLLQDLRPLVRCLRFPLFECLHEPGQQSAHSGSQPQVRLHLFVMDVAQSPSDECLGFQFHERAVGYRQVMEILTRMLASMAFCGIGRNRHRSPSKLRSQSVDFLLRKRPAHAVTFDHEFHGETPDSEVPVALDPGSDRFGHDRMKMVSSALHVVSFRRLEEHSNALIRSRRGPGPQTPDPGPRLSP